jgi:hypothetical protein
MMPTSASNIKINKEQTSSHYNDNKSTRLLPPPEASYISSMKVVPVNYAIKVYGGVEVYSFTCTETLH